MKDRREYRQPSFGNYLKVRLLIYVVFLNGKIILNAMDLIHDYFKKHD